MNKVLALAGAGVVLCSTPAFADPDPTVIPLDNAAAVVGAKAAANPDNRGLSNALGHIVQDNIPRQQEKRLNHPPGTNRARNILKRQVSVTMPVSLNPVFCTPRTEAVLSTDTCV